MKLPSNASKARSGTRADFDKQAGKLEAAAKQMIARHRVNDQASDSQVEATLEAKAAERLARLRKCRTRASPKMLTRCSDAACAQQRLVPHSCGHRHCPHCQHHESQQWLARQLARQLPAEYFLITFTVPAQFRALAAAQPARFHDLLIACSWETVRTFCHNDKQLAGHAGAMAVLHTHTRALDYHPHVHMVMPAAAVDLVARCWRTKPRRKKTAASGSGAGAYLFNHKALAKVFRAKLLAGLDAAGLRLPKAYPEDWVVDCKSVGSGRSALIYLGRYLYRGVIREQDIVRCAQGQVSFRYREGGSGSGRWRRRTVSGAEFLWLVLQHVLPKGFRRARNFGFLHPNSKRLIALLQLRLRFAPVLAAACVKPRPTMACPCCGAPMRIVRTRIPAREGLPEPPRRPRAAPGPQEVAAHLND